LEGPSIKVIVDEDDDMPDDRSKVRTWSLPVALLSHHSPYLMAECDCILGEPEPSHISLVDVSPGVFRLFVEWMYSGSDVSPCNYSEFSHNPHTLSWILGDKLQCTDFQNHTMRLLYCEHTHESALRAIQPHDFALVLQNKPTSNSLIRFYLQFVNTHFSDQARVAGTLDQWDKASKDSVIARKTFLCALRESSARRSFM
ncbi:hypothetical protein EK21DRAFT_38106, partial [Setomelanomma holmii]